MLMFLMRENLAFLVPNVVVVGPAVWTPLTHTQYIAVRWGLDELILWAVFMFLLPEKE